ncbi:unnamed protein product [Cladocopium goreaui]|uniref:Uncharacterized protein n=1 Tax=Cladocopium goreaui TaxID=2562237 RepID=A0A9P1GM03_9DINO|nr:unnamed protein product [Cladocopium goreaui]
MVKVPRFGPPPNKEKPAPYFPGVSATAFDPASALQAYTDVMRTEKENIAKGLLMYDKLDLAKQKFREGNADPAVAIPKKLSDMLPGYGSLAEFCHHLGYLRDPISGRFIPDESCSLEEKERTCLSAAPPLAKNRSSPSVALQRELKPLPTRPARVRRSTSSSSGISLSGQDRFHRTLEKLQLWEAREVPKLGQSRARKVAWR